MNDNEYPLPIIVGDSITIMHVERGDSLAIVKRLFVEYAESLDFRLCFEGFKDELAGLPGAYGLPSGRLLLARVGDKPAGCVALRPLSDGRCEMKRLWVRSEYRGMGLGRQLAHAVIDEARRIGYTAIRLDTVDSMDAAICLYRSLGFLDTEPSVINPIPGTLMLELKLND